MIGIYKITNKINGNAYIGLSVNIKKRWKDHISRSKHKNKEYKKALYRAFRKYGLENFDFEVIEECKPEQLVEKEKYWIEFYDTYHNGYNETPGGDLVVQMKGEKHPNHKLTKEDVIYIRELWASKTISTREMYYEFQHKIKKTGFKKIYTWQTWKDILPELNTQENRDWHRNNGVSYSNTKEKNPNAKLNKEQYEEIERRYLNGESPQLIYEDFNKYYKTYQSFYNSRITPIKKKQPVSTISVVGE